MAWMILFMAGLLEVVGVIILNEIARTKKKLFVVLLAVAFICSFIGCGLIKQAFCG